MLAHFERGEGTEPVVLLHGFMGSGRNLSALAREWAARDADLRFLVPDLTGHGTSPPLPATPDMDVLAGDLVDFARAVTPAGARIVGHSMGGKVALRAAQLAPELVSSVTLLDIAPGPVLGLSGPASVADAYAASPARAASRDEMHVGMRAAGVPAELVDWLAMNLVKDGDAYTWRVDREALVRLHAATRTVDLWAAAERVQVPLCVRGSESTFVSDDDAERLRALGSRVETLTDAGHFLHIDDLAGLVNVLAAHA